MVSALFDRLWMTEGLAVRIKSAGGFDQRSEIIPACLVERSDAGKAFYQAITLQQSGWVRQIYTVIEGQPDMVGLDQNLADASADRTAAFGIIIYEPLRSNILMRFRSYFPDKVTQLDDDLKQVRGHMLKSSLELVECNHRCAGARLK